MNPSTDPASTTSSTTELTDAMRTQIDAQLDAAMNQGPAPGATPASAPAHPGRPTPTGVKTSGAIRGPRLVQAGREHRTGRVVSIGPTDIFVEFGPKELGVVPRLQYPDDQVPVKDSMLEVVVDKFESSESLFICSRPGAVQKADWEMLDSGQTVEAKVTGVVTGKDGKQAGLDCEVAGHRAFMPASQVGVDHIPDLSVFVGQKLQCVVNRVERMGKGNIVLSRRDLMAVERQEKAAKLRETLAEGQTIEGIVRKIMPFGAFVDIGGVDGLIHISDLTFERLGFGEKAVAKHVQEGQSVSVRILKLDWEGNRISLGLKQVQGDPFVTAANSITEGAEVTGRVVSITEFGAFLEVAPGVQGLVHISELDHRRVERVGDVLKADQIVSAKVLKIDPGSRRISLSIKALKPLPEVTIGGGGGDKRGRKGEKPGRTAEEILKETPALRRMREKGHKIQFKGGLG